MIKPSFLFSDHTVLQWGKTVSLWGECDEDALTVTYLEYTVSAEIKNGGFTATLPAMPANLRGELIFKTKKSSVVYNDVVTGDVYIAGGQSNMEHPLFCSIYGSEDIAEDDGIRLFSVPRRPYENADVWGWHFYATRSVDTPWEIYNEKSAKGFSAVACYFAKRIRRDIDIPVGIISCNWGATAAESWITRERLLKKDLARWCVDNYDKKYKDLDLELYHAQFLQWHEELLGYIKEHDAMKEAEELGVHYVLRNFFRKTIKPGPYHYISPSVYRQTMLARVTPYTICGVIWYQGETNSVYPENPLPVKPWFKEVMLTLFEDWRDSFRNPELPFYMAQLSADGRGGREAEKEYFTIREVQQELGNEDNVYTVVTADIGEIDNCHPANKKPVGERLALCALANYYRKGVEWQSPALRTAQVNNSEILLTFDNAKELSSRGEAPSGFFVTYEDGATVPAEASLAGNTVRIKINTPVKAVGFCNRNWAYVNVYNENGLPLFPFEHNF